MVIAHAEIRNQNKSQRVRVNTLILRLIDKSGIELFKKAIDIEPYTRYDGGESREFTENFYVPTGLVGDIKELSSSSRYSILESSE